MKKFLAVVVFALAFAFGAHAQSTPVHHTDLQFIFPTDATPASIYKFYRAPLSKSTDSCSITLAFTVIGQVTAVNTYSDTNVQAGAINCYYVTHVLNGIESVPSTFFVNAKTGSTAIVTPGPNASSGGTATPQ